MSTATPAELAALVDADHGLLSPRIFQDQALYPFGFVIARRTIYLDQAAVLAPNLSMFF